MRGDYLPQTRRDFLRTSTLAAAGLMLSAQAALPATDTLGVSATRLERLRAGANLCRWFRFPRNETAEFFRDYIPDSEAEMMTRIGLKHVRLCVAPKEIMDATTGAVREDRTKLLEAAIRRLQRAGLLVMVDIHNEDRAAELDPDWQNAFMKFWGALAGRFAAFDPELTMLEIINEPVFSGREPEWNTLNARLAAVIREKAPQHTIVTSGPNWGGIDGLQKLTLLPDRNVIYSFHCYDPFPFTHQGATWAGEGVKPLRQVPYPSSPDAVMPLLSALRTSPNQKACWKSMAASGGTRTSSQRGFNKASRGAQSMEFPFTAASSACFRGSPSPGIAPNGSPTSAGFSPRIGSAGPSGAGTRASASIAAMWMASW
jgi:hypothetical protein